MKLQNLLDLSTFEITRFRIWNQTSHPDDKGVGTKYFNTNSGHEAYNREAIFTNTGWRYAAYLDDIEDITSNTEFIALKEKVELLSGDVDTDAIINNMKDVEAFLAGFAESQTLMDLLNSKLDKSGGIIEGNGADLLGINRKDGNPAIVFYHNGSTMGRIGFDTDGSPVAQVGGTYQTLLHSGNYSDYALPLSGGTMSGQLTIDYAPSTASMGLIRIGTRNANVYPTIRFEGDISWGYLGFTETNTPTYFSNSFKPYPLIHSGNIGDYALKIDGSNEMQGNLSMGSNGINFSITAGDNRGQLGTLDNDIRWYNGTEWKTIAFTDQVLLLDGSNAMNGALKLWVSSDISLDSGLYVGQSNMAGGAPFDYASFVNIKDGTNSSMIFSWHREISSPKLAFRISENANWSDWKTVAFTDSNVASATKLETARTIWGQSFDGTGDVSGELSDVTYLKIKDYDYGIYKGNYFGGMATSDIVFYAPNLYFYTSKTSMLINSSGNVTIGDSDLAGTTYKMSVGGKVHIRSGEGAAMTEGAGGLIVGYDRVLMIDANDIQAKTDGTTAGPLYINDWGGNVTLCGQNNGNVGIGTPSPEYKLDVNGTARFSDLATFNGGAYIPTGQTIRFGGTNGPTMEYADGAIKVTGNFYATGTVASGNVGEEGGGGGGGGSASVRDYTLEIGNSSYPIAHNFGTTNVIVQVFEENTASGSTAWDLILTDISITDANNIIVSFGRATTARHLVHIIGGE